MKAQTLNFVSILLLSSTLQVFVVAIPQWHQATDGRSYLIEPELKYNWAGASQECSRRGLQLVTIPTAAKNAAFDALLRTLFTKSPNLWIGATDHDASGKDRPFFWSRSEKRVNYANWAGGQPDNSKGVEHCVHIYSATDFKWNDINCSSANLGYICEGRFFE